MAKRIKNWDKLNSIHIGHSGIFYEILTDKIIESDTESEYGFGIWDLSRFVIEGKLVITQSTVTNISTGEKRIRDEYVLKLRTHNSTQLVAQYIMNDEVVMNFDLFKEFIRGTIQQMLNKIKEANEWKIQNGYTT